MSEKKTAKVSPIKGRDLTDLAITTVQKTVVDQRGFVHVYTEEMMPTVAQRASSRMLKKYRDNELLIQQLPEIEIIESILVSSILAPKDMVTVELTFSTPPGTFDTTLAGKFIQILDTHFDTVYKIKDQLQTIVSDALVRRGSYPIAVIPESNIDRLINGHDTISTQSLADALNRDGIDNPVGLLGPGLYGPDGVNTRRSNTQPVSSLQAYLADRNLSDIDQDIYSKSGDKLGIKVVDNYNQLKLSQLKDRLRQQQRATLLNNHIGTRHPSMQSFTSKEKEAIIKNKFYRTRMNPMSPVSKIYSEGHRENVGAGLIMHLPHEATIPIYEPGNPSHHVAYLIPLDEAGYPINPTIEGTSYEALQQRMNFNEQDARALLNQLTGNTASSNMEQSQVDAEMLTRLYADAVERDLRHRLANGTFDGESGIASAHEVWRMMMARHLSNKYTRLLFVPEDFVTYFAFDYNLDGTGRSLLEKNLILGSMRTLLTLAELYQAVQAATPNVDLNIELDPNDTDPQQTVNFIIGEHIRNATASFPFAVGNPADQIDYLQRSGIRINVTGNTRYPQTKVNAETRNTTQTQIDDTLRTSLKDRFTQGMWLNPEQIESAKREDFATSVIARNLLMNKRIISTQDLLLPQLKDHLYKYITANKPLMDELFAVAETAKRDEYPKHISDASKGDELTTDVLYYFLECLEVTLPRPDGAQLKTQMEELEQHAQYLDTILDYIVGRDIITAEELGPNAEIDMDQVKAVVKAIFMRRYIAENGILPELQDIMFVETDGSVNFNLMEEHRTHITNLRKTLGQYVVALNNDLQKEREKYDKRQEKMNMAADGAVDAEGNPVQPGTPTIAAEPATEEAMPEETGDETVDIPDEGTDVAAEETPTDAEETPDEAAKTEETAAEETPPAPDAAANEEPPEETPDENEKI